MSKSTIIVLSALLTLSILGVAIVFSGLHSIDGAWNLAYLQKNYNMTFVDSNAVNSQITYGDLYTMGIQQVMLGVAMIVFFLICYFRYVIYRMEIKHGAA